MKIEIFQKEETNITYRQIIELLHEAFNEHLQNGLIYSCSYIQEEEYISKVKNGFCYVVIINNTLVGTGVLSIIKHKKKRYGLLQYGAIKPNYQHKGIGSLLLNKRKEQALKCNCHYLLSDTSVNADSAVNYHLKNGFKIIGIESYRSTNYWSYVFRMQLTPSKLWNSSIFLRLHYICSYIFIRTTRRIDGSDTMIGIIYKKIIGNERIIS